MAQKPQITSNQRESQYERMFYWALSVCILKVIVVAIAIIFITDILTRIYQLYIIQDINSSNIMVLPLIPGFVTAIVIFALFIYSIRD